MGLHYTARYSQPQASTCRTTRAARVPVTVEDVRQVFLLDTDPRIAHGDDGAPFAALSRNDDLTSSFGEFDSVAQKVHQDLHDTRRIDVQRWHILRYVRRQFDLLVVGKSLHHGHGLLNDRL